MGRWGRGRHCTGERPDGDAGALPRPGEGDAQLAGACLLPGRDARAEERRGIRGRRRRPGEEATRPSGSRAVRFQGGANIRAFYLHAIIKDAYYLYAIEILKSSSMPLKKVPFT